MRHHFVNMLFLSLLFLAAAAASATVDPDVDPAHELILDAWVEDLDLEVLEAGAYLHKTGTGLTYLRLVLSVQNNGGEAMHAVDWKVQVDDIELTISPSALIEPGKSKQLSQLVLGTQVQGLNAGSSVSVGMVSRQSASNVLCSNVPTRAECELQRSAMQSLCWQQCIGRGTHGGQAVCFGHTHEDGNGTKCTFWTPQCVCEGRPSLTESLDAGLIDLSDPRAGGPVIYPPLLETRPLDAP